MKLTYIIGNGSIALALALSLTGCGLIKIREKDEASVQQIKKVAVAGFHVNEPKSGDGGLLKTAKGVAHGKTLTELASNNSPHVDEMYSELAKAVNKNLKWNVMDQKAMTSHLIYRASYEQTMHGFQKKPPTPQGYNKFLVKDVMDFDSLRILEASGRDKLMDSLGVDALVVAQVNVSLAGTTVMGIGPRRPTSSLTFFVYKRGTEKPVWFDGKIDGEESESIGTTGIFDETLLAKHSLRSAKTAFVKIGATQVQ